MASQLIHQLHYLRVNFAEEQVSVFTETAQFTPQDSFEDIEAKRQYIRDYYPLGTKQKKGTPLANIVECARDLAISALDQELIRRDSK